MYLGFLKNSDSRYMDSISSEYGVDCSCDDPSQCLGFCNSCFWGYKSEDLLQDDPEHCDK